MAVLEEGMFARRLVSFWLLLCGLGLVAGSIMLAGCAPRRPPPSSAPIAEPPPPDDRAPLSWAKSEPYFILIRRSCRTLTVYRYGEWLRTYDHLAFGLEPGNKLYEGDRRTPLGLYRIIGRRPHPRWARFLLIDYPNLHDLAAHKAAVESGDAPERVGGQVGIHGTDKPRFNQLGIDWTWGCVSLRNEDVKELYALVPDDTLVLIQD